MERSRAWGENQWGKDGKRIKNLGIHEGRRGVKLARKQHTRRLRSGGLSPQGGLPRQKERNLTAALRRREGKRPIKNRKEGKDEAQLKQGGKESACEGGEERTDARERTVSVSLPAQGRETKSGRHE